MKLNKLILFSLLNILVISCSNMQRKTNKYVLIDDLILSDTIFNGDYTTVLIYENQKLKKLEVLHNQTSYKGELIRSPVQTLTFHDNGKLESLDILDNQKWFSDSLANEKYSSYYSHKMVLSDSSKLILLNVSTSYKFEEKIKFKR